MKYHGSIVIPASNCTKKCCWMIKRLRKYADLGGGLWENVTIQGWDSKKLWICHDPGGGLWEFVRIQGWDLFFSRSGVGLKKKSHPLIYPILTTKMFQTYPKGFRLVRVAHSQGSCVCWKLSQYSLEGSDEIWVFRDTQDMHRNVLEHWLGLRT